MSSDRGDAENGEGVIIGPQSTGLFKMIVDFWLPCSPISPDIQGGRGGAHFFFMFSA